MKPNSKHILCYLGRRTLLYIKREVHQDLKIYRKFNVWMFQQQLSGVSVRKEKKKVLTIWATLSLLRRAVS